jgi:hypothetical protein
MSSQPRGKRRARGVPQTKKAHKQQRPVVKRSIRRPKASAPRESGFAENLGTAVAAIRKYGPSVAKLAGGALTKAMMSYVTGFGDYNIGSNTLMGMKPPEVHNSSSSGSTIISHREYLRDISASTVFSIQTFTINPGVETFPWLAQVATSFEQYRVRGMLFYFNSLSSPNILSASATTGLGAVIMATQYDVEDPQFGTKMEMENYCYANSRVPYKSFIHPIECARNQSTLTELYVRDGQEQILTTDARFYDLGKFSIATVGMQADTGVVGELWVTYEIELLKPKLSAAPTVETRLTDIYYATTGVTGAAPTGSSITRVVGSNLGTLHTANTFNFPANTLGEAILFVFIWRGDSTACTMPVFTYNGFTATSLISGGVASNGNITTTTLLYVSTLIQTGETTKSVAIGTAGTIPANATRFEAVFTVLTSQFMALAKIDSIEMPLESDAPKQIAYTDDELCKMMDYLYLKTGTYHREDVSEPKLRRVNSK